MYPMRVNIGLVAYRLCFAQVVEQLENGLVLNRNHKNQKVVLVSIIRPIERYHKSK